MASFASEPVAPHITERSVLSYPEAINNTINEITALRERESENTNKIIIDSDIQFNLNPQHSTPTSHQTHSTKHNSNLASSTTTGLTYIM